MNKEEIKILKDRLIEAIDLHLKNGGKLISGGFGYEDRCCPIDCLVKGIATHSKKGYCGFNTRMSRALGFEISKQEMWDFIYSYDVGVGDKPMMQIFNTDLGKLGKQIRKKYDKEIDNDPSST
jgi:hypothetical protein